MTSPFGHYLAQHDAWLLGALLASRRAASIPLSAFSPFSSVAALALQAFLWFLLRYSAERLSSVSLSLLPFQIVPCPPCRRRRGGEAGHAEDRYRKLSDTAMGCAQITANFFFRPFFGVEIKTISLHLLSPRPGGLAI